MNFLIFCNMATKTKIICFLFTFDTISSKNTGDNASCKYKKKDNYPLIKPGSDGSPVSGSNVIVLNPIDDSICTLQCAVGCYHKVYGNKAPFLCAPQTADRTSREGITTYPIICASK